MGQRLEATVSEPWDFEGADAANAVTGVIEKAGQDGDRRWVVLRIDVDLWVDGGVGRWLRLSRRYADEPLSSLALGKVLTGHGLIARTVDDEEPEDDALIAGSARLVA